MRREPGVRPLSKCTRRHFATGLLWPSVMWRHGCGNAVSTSSLMSLLLTGFRTWKPKGLKWVRTGMRKPECSLDFRQARRLAQALRAAAMGKEKGIYRKPLNYRDP